MQGPNKDQGLSPEERAQMRQAKKAIIDEVDKAWASPSERATHIMRLLMKEIYGEEQPEEISGSLVYDISCFCIETLAMINEQALGAGRVQKKDPAIEALLFFLYENHYSDPQTNVGPPDRLFWPNYDNPNEEPKKKFNEHGISTNLQQEDNDGVQQEQEDSVEDASDSPKDSGSGPRLLD